VYGYIILQVYTKYIDHMKHNGDASLENSCHVGTLEIVQHSDLQMYSLPTHLPPSIANKHKDKQHFPFGHCPEVLLLKALVPQKTNSVTKI